MKDWIKIILLLLLGSCSNENGGEQIEASLGRQGAVYEESIKSQEDFQEYSAWLKSEESNHYQLKKINAFEFKALLEPSLYSFIKNEGVSKIGAYKNEDFSEQTRIEYTITVPELRGELIKLNISDQQAYNERVNYYSFNFYKDVFLIIGSDTVPCGMSVWEREFNTNPSVKMQLLFPIAHDQLKEKKVQLVYYDRVFNNGLIKMNF